MSEPIRIEFAKQAYQARSKPLNSQRLVNMYLEPAPEGSKEPDVIINTPGLVEYLDIGTGPIYGMHVMGGNMYVVSGDNAYRVGASLGVQDLGTIGSVANGVIMDDDLADVTIVKEDGAAYLADDSGLSQIVDGDYVASSSVTTLHGYNIFTRLNSNIFHIGGLNNAATYDPTEKARVDGTNGNLVRAKSHKNAVWLFKELGTELYYDTGNLDFPFKPNTSAIINRGCAAKRSVVEEDNTLFFLGDDRIVYKMDGYTPTRISTFAIEKAIQGYATISDAEAFSYTQDGHKFYCITFPTESVSWAHDIATGLWHQRQSFEVGRWRASHHAFFNGEQLVGDYVNGKVYKLDLDTYTENGATIQAIAVTPPIYDGNKRITHDRLWIEFDSGVGLTTGQGSDPQVMLRYSDNHGKTWSNEVWASIGKVGEEIKVDFTCLGQARSRIYEITVTDPVMRHITGAYLNMRIGKA